MRRESCMGARRGVCQSIRLAGGRPDNRGQLSAVSRQRLPAAHHQLNLGPTNHWVSPSANLTSPLTPQFGLNFTSAPTRP